MHETHLLAMTGPATSESFATPWERAAILSEGALIDANHLALQSGVRRFREDTTDLSAVERTTIAKVVQDCRGNKTKAARRLGLSRTQLHLRIRKYGLEESATAQWRSSAARA